MPPRLDTADLRAKTVLLRADLNVPMHAGRVTDVTRIARLVPTIRYLTHAGAKVVILSHFGRPEGYDASLSLAPLVDALQDALPDVRVRFGVDCIGPAALDAVNRTEGGQVVLLENLRFHSEEKAGDPGFAKELGKLGQLYVNDAFSCSHRPHASIYHLPKLLPAYCGLAMQEELETLGSIFESPERPLMAIIGGSKISTKLELLENLAEKVDILAIGGAMAHVFLCAQGHNLERSYCEHERVDMAKTILAKASSAGCRIRLPVDLAVASGMGEHQNRIVSVANMPKDAMALDIGPETVLQLAEDVKACRTLVWNGPLGAFETEPYDNATIFLARLVARLSSEAGLRSIAGGGDTVAALSRAGVAAQFTYLSTAGGAFLEWLEGKMLPGVEALQKAA